MYSVEFWTILCIIWMRCIICKILFGFSLFMGYPMLPKSSVVSQPCDVPSFFPNSQSKRAFGQKTGGSFVKLEMGIAKEVR